MRYFILLLAFITTSVFANTVSTQGPTLSIGNGGNNADGFSQTTPIPSVDFTNMIMLHCVTLSGATSCTYRGSDYTPSGANSFRIYGISCAAMGTSQDAIKVGYTPTAQEDQIPVGAVTFGPDEGTPSALINSIVNCPPGNQNGVNGGAAHFYLGTDGPLMPNGNYLYIWGSNTGSYKKAIIYGKEE